MVTNPYTKVTVTDNLSVIMEWKQGKNARNHRGTLWTNNNVLWSQNRKIGHRTDAGVCIVADLKLLDLPHVYNVDITLAHIKLAKRFADTIFHELVSESSPLFKDEVPF